MLVSQLTPQVGAVYNGVNTSDFSNHLWQDKNSISRFQQLEELLGGKIDADDLKEIGQGLDQAGMSIRITPYLMSLIDWRNARTDPIRRQFLPMAWELEDDHPGLTLDSLGEQSTSPVPGLVHRYPDKVLLLTTSVCPVYCQFCTRSYAVGQDTAQVQKEHVTSAQNWAAAIDYIESHPQVEDVVLSGGDVARLKPANIRHLCTKLLDIEHVRRIRLATKVLSVQPMKILSDEKWFRAVVDMVDYGRERFKEVCVHTHFNHPNEITPLVEMAMRRLHGEGVYVRNQTVLLRGVNDDAQTMIDLVKRLSSVNIHPYYVYMSDMVTRTEHFRLPLYRAQEMEKIVRGSTAGYNTPLFVVDAPGGGGKRDIHSVECYDGIYGIAAFRSPSVDADRIYFYFDPLRSLSQDAVAEWRREGANRRILQTLRPAISREILSRSGTDLLSVDTRQEIPALRH